MQTEKQHGIANTISAHYWLVDASLVEIFQNAILEGAPKRKVFIVISSDKGHCSGIHSSVSKATHYSINTGGNGGSTDSPVVVAGEKSKAQLSRSLTSNFFLMVNGIGHNIPTFTDVASVVDLIVKSGIKYDAIAIVYDKVVVVPGVWCTQLVF